MLNPAGMQSTCDPIGTPCTTSAACCVKNCDLNAQAIRACCLPDGAQCSAPTDCCTNYCFSGICGSGCFSGDTKVKVEGVPGWVALRDVRTGQRVQCVKTTDDMRVPLTPTYCEVMNWYHAQSATYEQRRIAFTRPDGRKGSLTMVGTHLMVKLTSAAPGTTSTSYDAFGSFATLSADELQAGDLIAILSDLDDASQGFTATTVDAVETVEAEGMYLPGIHYPYLIADGVVAPNWAIKRDPLANVPEGADGVIMAFKQCKWAPIYMVRMQEIGTAGVNGSWDGNPVWPGVDMVVAAAQTHIDNGEVYDFAALRDWFERRYAAWRANASAGVTLDEMVALVSSNAIWTTPNTGLSRSLPANRNTTDMRPAPGACMRFP